MCIQCGHRRLISVQVLSDPAGAGKMIRDAQQTVPIVVKFDPTVTGSTAILKLACVEDSYGVHSGAHSVSFLSFDGKARVDPRGSVEVVKASNGEYRIQFKELERRPGNYFVVAEWYGHDGSLVCTTTFWLVPPLVVASFEPFYAHFLLLMCDDLYLSEIVFTARAYRCLEK